VGYYTIEWLEDIDLSGGSAAVALGLAGGRNGPYTASGTDIAVLPNHEGMRIKHLWAVNETVCNSGASFTATMVPRGNYELFPINLGTTIVGTQRAYNVNIPVPAGCNLAHLGFDGGGAEQSAGVVMMDDPEFPDPWNLKTPDTSYDEVIFVRPTTGARVLNQIAGHTDICGRAIAYTDAQEPIPASEKITIDVLHVQSNDVAGYSGPILVSPGKANLCLPCAATMGENWYLHELFDGMVPSCTGAKPFDIAGIGVTTATMTLSGLTLGINYS